MTGTFLIFHIFVVVHFGLWVLKYKNILYTNQVNKIWPNTILIVPTYSKNIVINCN